MGLYIFLAFLLLITARKPLKGFTSFIVFFSLIIVSALRSYYVGTDTANYLFNNIEQGNFERYLSEPLSYILLIFSPNHEFFIFTQSALVLLPLFLIHRKFEKPYLIITLYYLLGFYFFSFNISRQMIAAAFVLLGLVYYKEKNWLAYLIFMAIAFGFHNSSIIVLILPLCDRYLQLYRRNVYILLPLTFIVGVIAPTLFFSFFSSFLGNYAVYGSSESSGGFSLNRLLLNVFYLIVYNFSSKEGRDSVYMKSMFISIILYNLLTFSGVVNRIAMYFSIADIIILSQDRYINKNHKKKFMFAVYFYAFAYFSLVLTNNLGGVVPYEINPIYQTDKVYDLLLASLGTIIFYFIFNRIITHRKQTSLWPC